MALSWRTLRAIPRLLTYADAAAHEAAVKPIRGREPEVKPLGQRKQYWNYIKREDNGDITVGMWDGPLLRYRENGDLLIYDKSYWNKASSNEIIFQVTGIPTETFDGKAWVHTIEGNHYLRPYKHRVWNSARGQYEDNPVPAPENIFRRVEKSAGAHGYLTWSYTNPPTNMVHHIRRKEMSAVMKDYAKFAAYATAMDSLRGMEYMDMSEYVEPFELQPDHVGADGKPRYFNYNNGLPPAVANGGFTHAHAAELCALMRSDDAADNYKAYLWLRLRAYVSETPAATLIRRVVIKHHYKEVLKPVEAVGATKDRYAWAVPKQNHTA